MTSPRVTIAIACTLLVGAAPVSQQGAAELPPIAPAIAKVYDKGPDGLELYRIHAVVIEPASGALWIHYGRSSDAPLRVDRRTGTVKTIGRRGSGPNEYRGIFAMVPGAQGDVGIWDTERRLWFWVDSAGVQRRTWSVPTNNLMQTKVFSDIRGNVFIGQSLRFNETDGVVRVDSARGLRDTTVIPVQTESKWRWEYSTVSAGGGRGSSGTVVHFAPMAMWAIDRRGRLLTGWTDSNFVIVREGNTERRLQLPAYRDPLTGAERQQAKEGLDLFEANARSRNGQLAGARPPIPEFRHQISEIVPELDGGVAVVRYRTCAKLPDWRAPGSRAPARDPQGNCTIVERFDANGRRLTPFGLTYGDQLRAIRGDTAWVSHSDADGLSRVIEMVIPRAQ